MTISSYRFTASVRRFEAAINNRANPIRYRTQPVPACANNMFKHSFPKPALGAAPVPNPTRRLGHAERLTAVQFPIHHALRARYTAHNPLFAMPGFRLGSNTGVWRKGRQMKNTCDVGCRCYYRAVCALTSSPSVLLCWVEMSGSTRNLPEKKNSLQQINCRGAYFFFFCFFPCCQPCFSILANATPCFDEWCTEGSWVCEPTNTQAATVQ